jgi:hypothetical protein
MSWLYDLSIVLAAVVVLWVLATRVLAPSGPAHVGDREHPVGSVPSCPACRHWRDR